MSKSARTSGAGLKTALFVLTAVIVAIILALILLLVLATPALS